jgi:pimeloyl-ACP methyl ester carboxylesterase
MSYATVDGLDLWYEEHGSGEPLILLHGGVGASGMYDPILNRLAAGRRVITVDLPGHGHTADPGRPLRYEEMADQIAGLTGYLGLDQADLMGLSLGGGVALRTAIQHPGLIRRLVLVSAPFRQDGWYPEVVAGQTQLGPEAAEMMKQSDFYAAYSKVAPRPEDWGLHVSRVGELLGHDYDWSAGIAGITAPVLLVFGDNDSVRPAHIAEFFQLLGGGLSDPGWDGSTGPAQLAILPGHTHYVIAASPALAEAAVTFLDSAPGPEKR